MVSRPRQNRVTPFGTIEATPHRGQLMGNRGDLHAPDGSLGRQWKGKRWISCILDGGGWRAPMDQPGHNYPLFFHDEAVALAAGHRPCGQCRPEALSVFISAWKAAHGYDVRFWLPISEIDQQFHLARVRERKGRVRANPSTLPDGVFALAFELDKRPLLKCGPELIPWQHGAYENGAYDVAQIQEVTVLTPTPIKNTLAAGFTPLLDLQRVATRTTRQG